MRKKLTLFMLVAVSAVAVTLVAGSANSISAVSRPAATFQLAMVIKSTTNPYYLATLKGANMAVKELGGSTKNYGPTQSSAQAQIDLINQLAQRHTPAIAVAPSDPNAVVPAMKRAQQLGSKVITFDADSAPAGRPFLVNQATTQSVGAFGADGLGKLLGGKGKVAIVSAQPTAANQNAWIAAFRAQIKAKYPGVKIVDEVYGYDNEQKAFDATVALTTKYPDLAGIYAPTCPGAPAVARALESVNKGHGKIKLSGMCVPSITAKYMLDGTFQHFYLWDPVKLGYITYYAAYHFWKGDIKGKVGDKFTIPEGKKWPGTYTIAHNNDPKPVDEIVTGGPVQFTKANYKQYNF